MNIKVLVYASNACYTKLISPEEAIEEYKESEFLIDIGKKTWSFNKEIYKFSHERKCKHGSRWGVISVYDMDDSVQLNMMVYHSREATLEPSYSSDD